MAEFTRPGYKIAIWFDMAKRCYNLQIIDAQGEEHFYTFTNLDLIAEFGYQPGQENPKWCIDQRIDRYIQEMEDSQN